MRNENAHSIPFFTLQSKFASQMLILSNFFFFLQRMNTVSTFVHGHEFLYDQHIFLH